MLSVSEILEFLYVVTKFFLIHIQSVSKEIISIALVGLLIATVVFFLQD